MAQEFYCLPFEKRIEKAEKTKLVQASSFFSESVSKQNFTVVHLNRAFCESPVWLYKQEVKFPWWAAVAPNHVSIKPI